LSEQINNREYRKKVIKEIISELHQGKSVDDVKKKFEEAFDGVSAMEISEAEQALIAEGLPVEEVQSLCDVHAAVFKGSIEQIHQAADQTEIPGHPANVLMLENRFIEELIQTQIMPHIPLIPDKSAVDSLKKGLEGLSLIDIHYLRKENLLFPYMEKYGITAPPKVMWGVDDEIREQIKEAIKLLSGTDVCADTLKQKIEDAVEKVIEMIYKEENILIPMLLDTLTQDEWKKIADESGEIGFIIEDVPVWNPTQQARETIKKEESLPGVINLPTGIFKTDELIHMLNTLPFDITFVDKSDVVKYFSESTERIFPRTKAVIGRNVSNCHPPASVNVVEKIVADFKSGKKDHEDFWIKMGEKYILIRYFAVRNEKGEYMGVVEVTQNIKPIQEITGEKRLLSE
jgi:DUF438 domain-containing protein